jgi:hypothetical protein
LPALVHVRDRKNEFRKESGFPRGLVVHFLDLLHSLALGFP